MSAPLLRVENLTGSETSGPIHPSPVRTRVFERVSFDIAEGEHVAVVGAPGSGKTALVRAAALLEKSQGGKVYLEGRDITRLWGGQLRALRQRLQFVGGDPMRTLPPHYTVEQTLLEPLQIHRLGSADEQRARVTAVTEWFRLNPLLLTRKVSMLSAAMRQRVALARALTLHPRLLVCDELTDRLEPSAAQPLLAMVARACRAPRERIAWLWTTSDRALAHAFADRVLRLEDGQLVAD
jgi:ABC-type glutathione transport system ATPase component